jgi:hypothetical protein
MSRRASRRRRRSGKSQLYAVFCRPYFEVAEKGRGILRVDRDDDVQIVRRPGLPLKTRSDRSSDNILDGVEFEHLNHEPEGVERGH